MLASDGSSSAVHARRFDRASDIVELIVLTADDAFLATLREAVGGSRRLWHVPTGDKVSDLLLAGQVGIVVLDGHALHDAAGVFVAQIKRQFPDLVVLVAGDRSTETLLAGLISAGVVYRFIHKPLSRGRAQSFVESAVKKYTERGKRPTVPPVGVGSRAGAWVFAGIAAGVLTMVTVALWASHPWSSGAARPLQPAMADTSAGAPLLARAAAALAENRLTAPGGDDALDLYRRALSADPSNPAARAGVADVQERLLGRAENALLEERLDEAAAAIDTARRAGVKSERIAFLSSQLAKSREQIKSAPMEARAKRPPQATDSADGEDPLAQPLSLAAERMREGRLAGPDPDNARSHIQEALAIDPDSSATQALKQALAVALMSETHAAIDRRDFTRAATMLAAAEGIASPANVDYLRRLLDISRAQTAADAARTPMEDVPRSRDSSTQGSAVPSEPDAGGREPKSIADVVGANTLTRIKSVQPRYPKSAQQARTEGWVDLEFTVAQNGEVKDILVKAADPPGIFDDAAVGALSQWRYKPAIREGKPYSLRTRLRVRFELKD